MFLDILDWFINPLTTFMSNYGSRPRMQSKFNTHQLYLNPTDFVPLSAALTQFLCISICVYHLVLDCSSGLKGKAGEEGGGGSQYYYRLHCPGWPSTSPGPWAQQLTPCQFWLDSVLCSLVTAPGPLRSHGKVYNNKMLNWIPRLHPAHCSSLSSCWHQRCLLLSG